MDALGSYDRNFYTSQSTSAQYSSGFCNFVVARFFCVYCVVSSILFLRGNALNDETLLLCSQNEIVTHVCRNTVENACNEYQWHKKYQSRYCSVEEWAKTRAFTRDQYQFSTLAVLSSEENEIDIFVFCRLKFLEVVSGQNRVWMTWTSLAWTSVNIRTKFKWILWRILFVYWDRCQWIWMVRKCKQEICSCPCEHMSK